jgi:hypothetical protein
MAAVSTNFADLLDPRFEKIFNESKDREQVKDMIPMFFGSPADNGRADVRMSSVGAFGDFSQFSGSVDYDDVSQGYDVTGTHIEFTSGFQVERKLFDDDQYNIMDKRPAGLAQAATRTRQKHAARLFNNAFSVDTFFQSHSEGVALCTNSHTTNASGVDTSDGFDNLLTSALSATQLATARIQFVNFRDDRGNFFNSVPDTIVIPPDLYDTAYEIVKSRGKPDTAENNANVHEGAYQVKEWIYLTDSNNWFLTDSSAQKQHASWVDRIPLEFAMAEDIDTMVAKWRAYMRYMWMWDQWRFILGSQVS